MIRYLKGVLVEKSPTRLLLDVRGVGVEIQVTLNCSQQIGNIGDTVMIQTYLHVREDNLQLFGFSSKTERELFQHLISITGIGPKKALAILSGSNVDDLQRYIVSEDLDALTALSGVGRKTAQRLIIDLKEKLSPLLLPEQLLPVTSPQQDLMEQAVLALVSLGYQKNKAQLVVRSLIEHQQDRLDLEELIKQALKRL